LPFSCRHIVAKKEEKLSVREDAANKNIHWATEKEIIGK
jgi:hypothetical protein